MADAEPSTSRERPPGPDGKPLVGNTLEFARDPFAFVTGVAREYGPVAEYNLGGKSFYQLSDPELVEHVLVQNNQNYSKGELFQSALRPVLGNGLLTSEGEFWRQQRHLIQPAFHPEMLERYAAVMVEYTERLLDDWSDGETRDVHDDMMRLTVEIAANALFDVDIREEESEISGALEAVMDRSVSRSRRPYDIPDWVPTAENRRYQRALDDLDRVVERIVHEYREGEAREDAHDVVSLLLSFRDENGDPLPEAQIKDEVLTILLAGHETTALALTFTLHLLARNPDAETALHDELDDVLGGQSPTIYDLDDLGYVEQTITESMRVYPPVWEIVREADGRDEMGGYVVREGQTVTMQQWVLHRDPRFYEDPLDFRPDRWTDDFRSSLPRFAYFPFGGGPRRCIGDRFAMLEAQLALATIARGWTVEPRHDLSFEPAITLRPDGPVEMTVRNR